MEKNISLLEVFLTFLKINTVTFGGGYTIVPVIRDEFMKNKKLIDDQEMLDIVAIAQSGPGAMAISTSLLTGYRLRGFKGAIIALLASVLPCLVIITIVYYFYDSFRDSPLISTIMIGIGGTISAVLLITVYDMAKAQFKKHPLYSFVLMIGAFVSSYVLNVSTIYIIITLALIGLVIFSIFKQEEVK
ncbi:MAG: chromate transporter [Erysipelothrix sp.]|nr:chromate transporter [Erysipelothrix sp.]